MATKGFLKDEVEEVDDFEQHASDATKQNSKFPRGFDFTRVGITCSKYHFHASKNKRKPPMQSEHKASDFENDSTNRVHCTTLSYEILRS